MSEQDTGLRHAVASDVTRDARGGRRLRMSEQDTGLRQAVASRLRMSEQEMSEQDTGLCHAVASDVTRDAFDENLTFGGEIIMSPPSPLSVLSGALKIADKVTVALEAAGDKFA